ncbi:MAG: P-loop NTPase [Candidatus Sulfobium sp.]|jgi:MinD superfamily P-loop ATPase
MVDAELRDKILAALHRKVLDIPVVAVTGGKGGVGKSTIAINIAAGLAEMGHKVALMDADVEAPDDHIMLGITLEKPLDITINVPDVDAGKCTGCRICVDICRRNALFQPREGVPVLIGDCNGCEACMLACPEGALGKEGKKIGETYVSERDRLLLFTGKLLPAIEESSMVVSALRDRLCASGTGADLVLVDTSPGIHCNVINALRGADAVYAVTEPTTLGAHDLERTLKLLGILGLSSHLILNFSDLPGPREKIAAMARALDAEISCELPVDEQVLKSHVEGVPAVSMFPDAVSSVCMRRIAEDIATEYLQ